MFMVVSSLFFHPSSRSSELCLLDARVCELACPVGGWTKCCFAFGFDSFVVARDTERSHHTCHKAKTDHTALLDHVLIMWNRLNDFQVAFVRFTRSASYYFLVYGRRVLLSRR
jgi:hypothetical protein